MFSSTTRSLAAAAGLAMATASLAACTPSSSAHGLAVDRAHLDALLRPPGDHRVLPPLL